MDDRKQQKLPPPGIYPLEDKSGWRWIMSEKDKSYGVVGLPEGYVLLSGDHPDERYIMGKVEGRTISFAEV